MDKKVRLERAKELLRWHELPNLVFSDEKPLQIEQLVNKQNDRVYMPKRAAENLHPRLTTRIQAPPMVTVWGAVTADGRSPLVFIDRGAKINAEYYREHVLKTVLKPRQTNISASDHGHSNRTQHHRTQHASTKKKRFLA